MRVKMRQVCFESKSTAGQPSSCWFSIIGPVVILVGLMVQEVVAQQPPLPSPFPSSTNNPPPHPSNQPSSGWSSTSLPNSNSITFPGSGNTSSPISTSACWTTGNERYTIKEEAKDVLDSCAALFACDCIAKVKACQLTNHTDPNCTCVPTHPSTGGKWTIQKCDTLPDRSWLARNSWIWLVLVAVLIGIVIVIAIVCVYCRKFGDKGHKKDKRQAHLGMGTRMNIDGRDQSKGSSAVGGDGSKHGRSSRKSTRRSSRAARTSVVVGIVVAVVALASTLQYSEALIVRLDVNKAPSTVHNMSTIPMTNETDQTYEPETEEPETKEPGISNWIIFLVVIVVAIVLLAIITYCTHLTIEAAKVKRRGRKAIGINRFVYSDSESEPTSLGSKMSSAWQCVRDNVTSWFSWHQANQEEEEDEPIESSPGSVITSSNAASSPTTSSAVRKHKGIWKSVKGSITSLLNGTKAKQAKAVAKEKNSKVKPKEAKSKVDKSPKSGASP